VQGEKGRSDQNEDAIAVNLSRLRRRLLLRLALRQSDRSPAQHEAHKPDGQTTSYARLTPVAAE